MKHYSDITRLLLPVILFLNMISCTDQRVADEEITFRELYRPQFHYTPPENWMNDPNGLFYHDGKYYLHHQYNPHGDTWGHMSWKQAISTDLVHWEHTGVVIPEEGNEMIFSGSAVVDHNNTSGFGSGDNPPVVAIYTSHYTYTGDEVEEGETAYGQDQSLAYSLDGGRTFTKYEGNPVLSHDDPDFRDPNVMWHGESGQWVMVVALSVQRVVQFYGSTNLKEWQHLSDFGPAGSVEGIWECPDLFELNIDGDPDNTRWILHVDVGSGAISGGSGSQYFIGDFDGTAFSLDSQFTADDVLWTDFGTDFYAAISWSDIPASDGRRIWIGWMSNWSYAEVKPTSPWRSAQSVPRQLEIITVGDGVLRLAQHPVVELQILRGDHQRLENLVVNNAVLPLEDYGLTGSAYELIVELDAGQAQDFGLNVRAGENEMTRIGYNVEREVLYVDRINSGVTGFHESFPSISEAPLKLNDGKLSLHILVDWSSVEVFAENGRKVFTSRIFPDPGSQEISVFAEGGEATINALDFWTLNSIWN